MIEQVPGETDLVASDRFLFDNSADAIFVGDGAGRLIDANAAAGTLLGYPRKGLVGLSLGDILVDADAILRAGSGRRDAPCRLWHADGSLLAVRLSHTTGRDGQWRAIGRADPPHVRRSTDAGNPGEMADLRRTEERLQTLMEGIPQLVWRADVDGAWTWAGPQWTAFTGQTEEDSYGEGWLRAVHPEDRPGAVAFWRLAAQTGVLEMESRVHRRVDGSYRWFQTRASPVRDGDGRIVEWLGTSTDVDDLRRMQQRQQVLVAELQHRVRNMLTVVRSVFSRTVEADRPIEEISDHFRGRLDNLARTQVIVTQSASGLVDLETLVRDELLSVGSLDGSSVTIEGPEIGLPPVVAESIGLAVHELTTNAVKYGALKIRAAALNIHWKVAVDQSGKPLLVLNWIESGVPAVPVEPPRSGFGSELINEALPYRLGAKTSLEFAGGGVRCSIALPLPPEADLPSPS